jgi:hypothetical protein
MVVAHMALRLAAIELLAKEGRPTAPHEWVRTDGAT